MRENMKKFLELIASNKEIEAKALACNELGEEKGKIALIELAKENGIELTLADFEKKEEAASNELSDDELDAVAGGACGCAVGGGGKGIDGFDDEKYKCVCVVLGEGGADENGSNCSCLVGGCGLDDFKFKY